MKTRFWLGLAISLLLILLMFRSLELDAVGRAMAQAEFAYLLPAVLLYFAGVFVRTARWAVLMRPLSTISLRRLFSVMVVGFTANDVLPLRAGEAVRAYLLWKKERLEPGATVATIVVERIFDGLALTGFLIAGGLLISLESWLSQLAWFAAAAFLLAVGVVFGLTIVPAPLLRLANMLLSPLPPRLRDLSLRLLTSFVEGLTVLRRWQDTAAVAVLSVVAWLLEASMYYVLMFSFPFKPQYLAAILGTAVANLGTMVPSSPGYVGTFDLPLSAVLVGTFQIDRSLAASYTLLVHATLILPVVLLGVFFLWKDGLSLSKVTSQEGYRPRVVVEPTDRPEIAPRRTAP